jgi:hypothetical protein
MKEAIIQQGKRFDRFSKMGFFQSVLSPEFVGDFEKLFTTKF